MKIAAIIQARTGSTRLPGKVLKPVLGEPMLARMLERVKRAKCLDAIVVATTDKPRDEAVAALAKKCSVSVFRGNEDDVLDRMYRAAKEAGADIIVGLTADCPLHDPQVIDDAVRHFIAVNDPLAYAGTPGNYPEGLDTDISFFTAFEEAWARARLHSEREHIAQYFKNHPERYRPLPWTADSRDDSQMHWSVDTKQDFDFVTAIFENLYSTNPNFTKDDILALLARRPELLEINKGGTGYEGLAKTKKKDAVWARTTARLALGTMQLGRTYGVDGAPQPSSDESHTILDRALSAGITAFDTAGDYGSAADLLGEWMQERGVLTTVSVVSKLEPRVLGEAAGDVDAVRIVHANAEQTLKRLRVPRLSSYLLSNSRYVFREDALAALRALKRENLVGSIGVSIYDEDEAQEALRQRLDCIEVPYNAFDQRLDKTDFWKMAQQQGTTVLARSPFLQGLLVMRPEQVPLHLAQALPHLETFIDIARQHGLSQVQAALLFSLHACPAQYIVFGVKTLAQLEEILVAALVELPPGFVEAVKEHFEKVDCAIVNPSLWSKAQK